MKEAIKKGDKYWINWGFDVCLAEIVKVYEQKGVKLIEFRHSFGGGRISLFARFFRYFMTSVETEEEFLSRVI